MTDKQTPSSGIGFIGLLQIVFITLKLTGHITWPWWCVMLPMLIPLAIVAAIVLFCVFMALLSLVAIKFGGK